MKPESEVISVLRKYKIHCERHLKDGADKTAIMVNGALATTISFTQTLRNLKDYVNVVLFDLPFAGKSRQYNQGAEILTKEHEVEILLDLIDRFKASYIVSASWGGVAALLSLARRPQTVEKAVVLSFSPIINEAMREYMTGARQFLQERDIQGGAHLLNRTVGKYLPRLLKSHNHEYLLRMVEGNESQIMFHIDQIFSLDHSQYVESFRSIDVPVLFINGALDEYTTTEDVRLLARYVENCEFAVVPNAGHFLDLESTETRRITGEVKRKFLFSDQYLAENLSATASIDLEMAM